MNCNKTQIIFLIANLIANRKITVGTIIDIEKIVENCPKCSKEEIIEVLECFVKEGLLTKTNTYICKNDEHYFTPSKQELEEGYLCFRCCDVGLDEEDCYIEPDELQQRLIGTTYRINDSIPTNVLTAKSLYMIGDIEKAVAVLAPIIKDLAKTDKNPKNIAEKIAPYLSSMSSAAVIADKITPFIQMFV